MGQGASTGSAALCTTGSRDSSPSLGGVDNEDKTVDLGDGPNTAVFLTQFFALDISPSCVLRLVQ